MLEFGDHHVPFSLIPDATQAQLTRGSPRQTLFDNFIVAIGRNVRFALPLARLVASSSSDHRLISNVSVDPRGTRAVRP